MKRTLFLCVIMLQLSQCNPITTEYSMTETPTETSTNTITLTETNILNTTTPSRTSTLAFTPTSSETSTFTATYTFTPSVSEQASEEPGNPYDGKLHNGKTISMIVDTGESLDEGIFDIRWETDWINSDIDMTLRAPDGQLWGRNTKSKDLEIFLSYCHEFYEIKNIVSGEWQVSLYGTNLPPEGVFVLLTFTPIRYDQL